MNVLSVIATDSDGNAADAIFAKENCTLPVIEVGKSHIPKDTLVLVIAVVLIGSMVSCVDDENANSLRNVAIVEEGSNAIHNAHC